MNNHILNMNKCMQISLHRKRSNSDHRYNLADTKMNVVNEVRDLGII